MKVTKGLKKAVSADPSILTLGTFDGVHKGHKKIISRLINEAKEYNLKAIILTFFPHPRSIFSDEISIKS